MPITDTTNGLKRITTAQALVARLEEWGCKPGRVRHGEVEGWRATCPFDPPDHPGSCGYLTIREGQNGEALVANLCPHSLSEVICALLGIYPDDPRVWSRRGQGRKVA